MSTQLQMVNRVLRRLREDTVETLIGEDYAQLIAEFINAGIEEVIQHHDWKRYERFAYVTVASGTNTADISATVGNGGDVEEGDPLTPQSQLIWSGHDIPTVLFTSAAYASAKTSQDWHRLSPASHQEMRIATLYDGGASENQEEEAMYFDVRADSTDRDDVELVVWPYVAQASTVLLHHWTPPAELEIDGTDQAVELKVPEKPVFEFALMMALNERGEELGEPGNLAEQRYYMALARAVETDLALDERNNEFDWRRD